MKNVTAAIIQRDDKYLLARRAPGQNLAGYWEFPGGKVEADETFEDCLARELMEELNLETQVLDHFCDSVYHYDKGSINLVAYRVQILGGNMTLSVHDQVDWFKPQKMLTLNLAPANRLAVIADYYINVV
jgi:8-oxo-dGTP diphosphatase